MSRATKVHVSDVRDALDAVAGRHPYRKDRRHSDSLPPRYIDQGQPACLVALILIELGFSANLLRDLDRERPVGTLHTAGVQISESQHPALRRIDPLAMQLLRYLQGMQDSGYLWSFLAQEAFKVSAWSPVKWQLRRRPWLAELADA